MVSYSFSFPVSTVWFLRVSSACPKSAACCVRRVSKKALALMSSSRSRVVWFRLYSIESNLSIFSLAWSILLAHSFENWSWWALKRVTYSKRMWFSSDNKWILSFHSAWETRLVPAARSSWVPSFFALPVWSRMSIWERVSSTRRWYSRCFISN